MLRCLRSTSSGQSVALLGMMMAVKGGVVPHTGRGSSSLLAASTVLLNRVQVGGSSSIGGSTSSSPLQVDFGSVKSRERRRAERMTRNKQTMERLNDLQESTMAPTEEADEQAKTILNHSYGFSHKPPTCYFHRQFLSELRRYEMDWESTSHTRTVIGFKITDRGIDGKADSPVILCSLRGDNDKVNSFGDFHQGINKLLFEITSSTYSIPFKDEFGLAFELQLSSVFPLVAPASSSSAVGTTSRKAGRGSADDEGRDDDEEMSYGDTVRREVDAALKRPFVTTPGGPFRRYTQRINVDLLNCQTGVSKPLVRDVSIQAFGFAYITGVSRFMRAQEFPGSAQTNRELFFSKTDYEYIRYNFVTFRQQLGMKPIDNMDLNMMLPHV